MAILAVADFRAPITNPATANLALTTTEAADALVTSTITAMTARLEDYCHDKFESASVTVELTGNGLDRLYLPYRFTAISSVKTYDVDGTETVQTSTNYVLHPSLNSTGSATVGELDWLDVEYLGDGLNDTEFAPYTWPYQRRIVVAGTAGWTTTPTDIKRALALMVFNHLKPIRNDLGFATRWTDGTAEYSISQTEPTGIPEADEIIARYTRITSLGVG